MTVVGLHDTGPRAQPTVGPTVADCRRAGNLALCSQCVEGDGRGAGVVCLYKPSGKQRTCISWQDSRHGKHQPWLASALPACRDTASSPCHLLPLSGPCLALPAYVNTHMRSTLHLYDALDRFQTGSPRPSLSAERIP